MSWYDPDREDDTIYKVVINREERYLIGIYPPRRGADAQLAESAMYRRYRSTGAYRHGLSCARGSLKRPSLCDCCWSNRDDHLAVDAGRGALNWR